MAREASAQAKPADRVDLARRERDEAREAYLAVCRRQRSSPEATTAGEASGEAWRAFQEAEARYQERKRQLRANKGGKNS